MYTSYVRAKHSSWREDIFKKKFNLDLIHSEFSCNARLVPLINFLTSQLGIILAFDSIFGHLTQRKPGRELYKVIFQDLRFYIIPQKNQEAMKPMKYVTRSSSVFF